MASRYWVAFSSTNWNDSFNWASTSGGLGGASVPSTSDDVFFDGNGTGSCSLDVNASVISITIDAGYTGTLDAVTFDLTTSGNFTDNAGRILFGSGTWNIGGNLTLRGTSNTDCQSAIINVTGNVVFNGGSWIPGTSVWTVGGSVDAYNGQPASSGTYPNWSFTQTGTAKTAQFRNFANYTIASGASITNARSIDSSNVTIDGTHDLNGRTTTVNHLVVSSTGTVKSTASGGHLHLNVITNSFADVIVSIQGTLIPNSWKMSGGGRNQKYITRLQTTSGLELPNFEFGATSTAGGDNWRLQIENDVVFAQDFLFFSDGSGTPGSINNSTYNPNITFKGDVTFRVPNGMNYNVGTGTITLQGSSAQSVDFSGQTVEAIVVSDNSANAITLASNFTTPYVHDCANQIDENGYTVTTTGSDPSPCSTGTRYWVGLVDSDYENSGNWSTSSGGLGNASVPVGSNDVVFDSGSSVNCTMSASRSAASITWTGYSGSFDAVSNNFFCVGNFTRNTNVSVDLGSGTWTVGGTYYIGGHQNLTAYSATLVMTGTGVGYKPNSQSLGTLIIETGANVTGVHNQTSQWTISNLLDVRGTFSLNDGRTGNIADGGELKVSGSFVYASGGTAVISLNKYAKITEYTGTIGVDLRFICDKASSAVYESLLPGTYGGNVTFNIGRFTNQELRLPAGSYVFNGNVSFAYQYGSPTLTVNNSTNNPSITFGGDVTLTDPYAFWSAGDGTIIFDNSGSQSVNFNGQTVEGIHVTDASTGSIVLASDFSTAWLRDCDSLIDLNGYTITNADSVDRCVYPYDPPTTIALDSAAAINVDQQLWLPMLEVSGTTTPDLSGNSNDGTLDAGLSHTVTTLGGAISFPENGGIDSSATISSQPYSVSLWGYMNSATTYYYQMFIGQTSGSRPTIYINNSSLLKMYGGSNTLSSTTTIGVGEWFHVVGVFDGSSSALYVNGAVEASGAVGPYDLSGGMRIGHWWTGGRDFDGNMQNVRVWSRALSSSEVSSLYSDPWIGSDYIAVVPPSNRYFSPAAFARLG